MGKRQEGQTPISLWIDGQLLSAIDSAREYEGRSLFIRIAIAERLKKLGIDVPKDAISGDRVKKESVSLLAETPKEMGPSPSENPSQSSPSSTKVINYRQKRK